MNCGECPARHKAVPTHKPNYSSTFAIIGEAPGTDEIIDRRPFVGSVGRKIRAIFDQINVNINHFLLTNAILCRPEHKMSAKEWTKAQECCRDRLEQDLQNVTHVLTFGKWALRALTNQIHLPRWCGGEYHKDGRIIIPTMYPVGPQSRIVERHCFNAYRLSVGDLQPWKWPDFMLDENEEMERWLTNIANNPQPVGLDIETAGDDRITCVGIATNDNAASVPWPTNNDNIRKAVKHIVTGPHQLIMQNGQFDVRMFERVEQWIPNNFTYDTLYAHQIVAPLLPHNLGFIAACEFHAPRWKTQWKMLRKDKKTPRRERFYNAQDSWMTKLLPEKLDEKLHHTKNGFQLLERTMKLVHIASRMTDSGFRVSAEAREKHQKRLTEKVNKSLNNIKEIAAALGFEGNFNPRSPIQVRKLYEEILHVKSRKRSKISGQASYDEEVLNNFLMDHKEEVRVLSRELLEYRKWQKLLSTYVKKLELVDGFVHAQWTPGRAVTGRFGCKAPNLMNIPKPRVRMIDEKPVVTAPGLRDMFIPHQDGQWLVAADYAQLELRIITLLAGDGPLLDAFNNGIEAHGLNAQGLFNVEKFTKRQRHLAKIATFAICYLAEETTIYKQLIKDFPDMTLKAVRKMKFNWLRQHPDIVRWQRNTVEFAKKNFYTEAPISGRRAWFHEAIDPNIAVNFPVQATGADIMDAGMLKLNDMIDWQDERIMAQVHDELVCCGSNPYELARKMQEAMETTITINGNTLDFPIDWKIGRDWGNVKEYTKLEDVKELL